MRYRDEYSEEAEFWGEAESEFDGEFDEFEGEYETDYARVDVSAEAEELELAAELLEIDDEYELDQFLGRLIKRAGRAAGKFVRSDAGRALGGMLKKAAKKALPAAGKAIGGYFGGATGAQIGGRVAPLAGRMFGLELEGLSPEDQEFEAARRVVRLAKSAATNLAALPPASNPHRAAKAAMAAAATRHAPGLLRPGKHTHVCPHCGAAGSGRWVRRGRDIVVINYQGQGGPQTAL